MISNDRMSVFKDLCTEYGFEDIYEHLTAPLTFISDDSELFLFQPGYIVRGLGSQYEDFLLEKIGPKPNYSGIVTQQQYTQLRNYDYSRARFGGQDFVEWLKAKGVEVEDV